MYVIKIVEILSLKHGSLNEIALIWQELESFIKPKSISCSWDWVSTWLSIYGDLIPYEFVCGSIGNTVCGICLISKETGRFLPFPVAAYHLGTSGEPIKERVMMLNNHILVRPDCIQQFVNQFVSYFLSHYSWDEFRLEFFERDDVDIFTGSFDQRNFHCHLVNEEASVLNLKQIRDTHKPLIDLLGNHTRHSIRRTLKGLDNSIRITYAERIDEARIIFSELCQHHQQSWQLRGKRGMFASRRYTSFHREIIEKLFPLGKIMLFKVSSDYGPVGYLYGFIEDNCLLGYQSAFAYRLDGISPQVNPKRIHPGYLTHFLCAQSCLDRGLNEYNFGPAIYQYKKQFSNMTKNNWTLSIRNNWKAYIRDEIWNYYIHVDRSRIGNYILRPFYSLYKMLT